MKYLILVYSLFTIIPAFSQDESNNDCRAKFEKIILAWSENRELGVREKILKDIFELEGKCKNEQILFFKDIRFELSRRELMLIRQYFNQHFIENRTSNDFDLLALYKIEGLGFYIIKENRMLDFEPLDRIITEKWNENFALTDTYFSLYRKLNKYIKISNIGDSNVKIYLLKIFQTRYEIFKMMISREDISESKKATLVHRFYNHLLGSYYNFMSLEFTESCIQFIDIKYDLLNHFDSSDVGFMSSTGYFIKHCVSNNLYYSKKFRAKYEKLFLPYYFSYKNQDLQKLDSLIEQFKLEARQELARYENVNQD